MPPSGLWQQAQLANQLQGTRFVKGYEGAMSCPCLPGRTLLMDEDEDVFYIKEVSGYGNATIRRFRFEEIPEPKQPEYVTKDEFDELRRRYEFALSRIESLAGNEPARNSAPSPSDLAATG